MKRGTHRVLVGDCMAEMATLPDGHFHACMTSPPYFALRSYLPAGHPDKDREIGSEPTPAEFIATMVAVFREVRRVLRDDGFLWVNLGDSYDAGGRVGHGTRLGHKQQTNVGSVLATDIDRPTQGMAGQQLLMPHRVAMALQADGWVLRDTVIWSKRSPMPSSQNGVRWERCKVKVASQVGGDGKYTHETCKTREVNSRPSLPHPSNGITLQNAKYKPCPGCPKCEKNGGYVLRRGQGRFTTSFEYLFLFTKTNDYFWDHRHISGVVAQHAKMQQVQGGKAGKRLLRESGSQGRALSVMQGVHEGCQCEPLPQRKRAGRKGKVVDGEGRQGPSRRMADSAEVNGIGPTGVETVRGVSTREGESEALREVAQGPSHQASGIHSESDAGRGDRTSPGEVETGQQVNSCQDGPKAISDVGCRQGSLQKAGCSLEKDSQRQGSQEKSGCEETQCDVGEVRFTDGGAVGANQDEARKPLRLLQEETCRTDSGSCDSSEQGWTSRSEQRGSGVPLLQFPQRSACDYAFLNGEHHAPSPRSVITLSSEPSKYRHFATYPSSLVRICLGALSAAGCCPECGAQWAPVVESEMVDNPGHKWGPRGSMSVDPSGRTGVGYESSQLRQTKVVGYRPTCSHVVNAEHGFTARDPVPCRVLDPFSGTGTTGQTACFLGHDYVGIELNPDYAAHSDEWILRTPRWKLREKPAKTKKKRRLSVAQGELF